MEQTAEVDRLQIKLYCHSPLCLLLAGMPPVLPCFRNLVSTACLISHFLSPSLPPSLPSFAPPPFSLVRVFALVTSLTAGEAAQLGRHGYPGRSQSCDPNRSRSVLIARGRPPAPRRLLSPRLASQRTIPVAAQSGISVRAIDPPPVLEWRSLTHKMSGMTCQPLSQS